MLQKIHFPYPKPNAHKLQPALNYKQVFTLANLELAFTKVFNNQGAAGRDGVIITLFAYGAARKRCYKAMPPYPKPRATNAFANML
ncbi:hypothetical protein [Vibrio metschnikovii]|uniref:hypothetical protein n=1 Tax=Vibrio metschnikovii TaxID=28172 RepID=UPI001C2F35F5|nr:hypothetical protein [Vibrio metschnikovii]